MLSRSLLSVSLCAATLASCSSTPTSAPGEAPAAVPLDAKSPWPKFRGNAAQDGQSAVKPSLDGGAFFTFRTGKGVFSSPIVGADGTVYVGSADRNFYAIRPDGTLRWKVQTGEIIDSSGLLDDKGRVYFGSGDGKLRALDAATGNVVWTFGADDPKVNRAFINWFEGNVAIGPTGTLYVPNDNFFVYAIDRDTGVPQWKRKMPDQTWSLPAVDAETGRIFIGNNNLLRALGNNTFALDPKTGEADWETSTLGTIAASPMYADDAMVVGGFDGYVRSYDAKTGTERWSFATRDHLYSSPARLPDGSVVQASCDGTVYALDPKTGAVRWAFDSGEAIRSSPAVDGDGNVYLGTGDGRLLVLTKDGKRRWSMLLVTESRNDLNASPALGKDAIYVAGESGEVFSVPYDYCLRSAAKSDARCLVGGDESLPRDGAFLVYTSAFGALQDKPAPHHANRPITLSLFVRAGGDTRLATLDAKSLSVTIEPKTEVTVDVAGDGKFVTLTPATPFAPRADGSIRVSVTGKYLVDHTREGLRLTKGTVGGDVKLDLALPLAPKPTAPATLAIPTAGAPATTWELARLALPLPTLMPSYNQIGFDSLHYVVGVVEGDATHGIAWMAGALLDDSGAVRVDPTTKGLVPLEFAYEHGLLTMRNEDGLKVEVMNVVIPFRTFRVATALDDKAAGIDELTLGGSTVCAQVPFYGPFLQTLGLCNPQTDVLAVFGAAKLKPMEKATAPAAFGTATLAADATSVSATIAASTLDAKDHLVSLLIVDADTGKPLTLDYGTETIRTVEGGKVTAVRIPLGTKALPKKARVHLLVDTYPAVTKTIGG